MSISAASKKWAEAARVLAANPNAVVICPENADGNLEIRDHVFENDPSMIERWLICGACGAKNVIRMRLSNDPSNL